MVLTGNAAEERRVARRGSGIDVDVLLRSGANELNKIGWAGCRVLLHFMLRQGKRRKRQHGSEQQTRMRPDKHFGFHSYLLYCECTLKIPPKGNFLCSISNSAMTGQI